MATLFPNLRRARIRLRLVVSLPLLILLVGLAGIAAGYAIVMNAQRDSAFNHHLAAARSLAATAERAVNEERDDAFDALRQEVDNDHRARGGEGVRFVAVRTEQVGPLTFYDPEESLTDTDRTLLLTATESLAISQVIRLGLDGDRYLVMAHWAIQNGLYLIAIEPFRTIQKPARDLMLLGTLVTVITALGLFAAAWALTTPLHRMAEQIRVLAQQELADPSEVEEIVARSREPEETAALALALEQALNALINLKRSVHGIIESMEGGIIATDQDGLVRYVNSSARAIMGLEGQLAGRPVRQIIPSPDQNGPLLSILEELLEERLTYGRTREIEFRNGRGERMQLGASTGIVPDEEGNVLNFILTVVDLTDLVDLQNRVRQADRLSSLGSMATKVAHEIRNPLGSVKGLAQLVLESSDSGGSTYGYTERIVREVDRLSSIVDELLEYSQRRTLSLDWVDLNEVVGEGLEMAQFQSGGRGPTLRKELDLSLPRVRIDRNRFLQATLNIVLNAIQAVGSDGVVTVSTYIDESGSVPRVAVEISDNGPGIPPEVLEHILDPFYTTKENGSGLGLSIAHTIIREHEGALQVESRVGRGTTFRIVFPKERWEEVKAT
jgi:PAS domain S-box-containing protein